MAGDKIVVLVDISVRLKHETEWREGWLADGFTFRDGKAFYWRTFDEPRDALEWAGADASRGD